MRFGRSIIFATTCFSLAALVPSTASAGGFELPGIGTRATGRAGAYTVLADDPTAIGINPAGLIRDKGTRLLLDWSGKLATISYTGNMLSGRSFAGNFVGQDPTAEVTNDSPFFPLGAQAVLVSDFGLDDWAFAIGVYGPNAFGGARYNKEGGQRYLMTDLDMILLYYTLSVAYGWEDTFGVGISLQYAHVPAAKLSLVVDGTPSTSLNPYESTYDMLANLEFSDPGKFTMIIGGWYRIIPELEIGVSARVVPTFLALDGTITLDKAAANASIDPDRDVTLKEPKAKLDLTLPAWVRGGLRYRHLDGSREVFDIELDVVWENWSVFQAYDLTLLGKVDVSLNGQQVIQDDSLDSLKIDRLWRDTVSVRLGGTWNALPDTLWWSLGAYYETAAAPKGYEHLDFLAHESIGISTGFRASFYGIDLQVSYMHVFQESRSNDERSAKVFQQRPITSCPAGCNGYAGVPANNGTFKSSFDIFNVSLQMHFDEWVK